MIHICKEWLSGEDIWVLWDSWEIPNLNRRWTFKKYMIYGFLRCSTTCASCTPCIPLACNFFFTAIYPDTNCHKKCFILGGHLTFQQKSFSGENEGRYSSNILSPSRYTRYTWYPDLTVYLPLLVKFHPSRSAIWLWLNGKILIVFTSWGSINIWIACRFQVLEFALMRESNVRSM